MKKPTIEALQKQIADLTARHDAEYKCRLTVVESLRKANDTIEQKDRERRDQDRDHAAQLKLEREAREDAQQSFVHFKGAVLHYFMVVANPETAKNTEAITGLQQMIANAGPDFRISVRPSPHF